MKNFFLILLAFTTLISCEKNTLQQTTDNIKRADSLFTKANQGIKTLDSISKTISDSNGIAKKVIIPEIQKQKKSIDSTIKNGSWRIDSINKQIEKITKNVVVGTEVAKTLDSANTALQKGENALKVLTRTADKILKQTKQQSATEKTAESTPEPRTSDSMDNASPAVPPHEGNPIVKNATLEIQVDDLASAQAILKQKIRENNADLVTENFSQNEGIQRQRVTAKVPLQYFDRFVADISSNLGDIKSKNTETEGNDFFAAQNCDVEILLVQNENIADLNAGQNGDQKENDGFIGAFLKGFKMLGAALLFLVPFWPVFLIAGLIWFIVRRNRVKKRVQNAALETHKSSETPAYPTDNQTSSAEQTGSDNSTDDDYSKYMPK